jgi:hypothetical protein
MRAVQNFAGLFGIVGAVASAVAFGADGLQTPEYVAIGLILAGGVGAAMFSSPRVYLYIVRLRDSGCRLERAQERDVPAMHAIATQHFGANVTSQRQMRGYVKRNKNIFWVLISSRQQGRSYSVDGYLCLIPMTELMAGKADRHEFDVTLLFPGDIPGPREQAHAIYIGAVVGRTVRAKGQALGHLLEKAQTEASKTVAKTIYARAASDDGLRLLNDHDFTPVLSERIGLSALYRKTWEAEDA